jgi:hypothetical protein
VVAIVAGMRPELGAEMEAQFAGRRSLMAHVVAIAAGLGAKVAARFTEY